jgi:L-iditol 2-dehydrogenase
MKALVKYEKGTGNMKIMEVPIPQAGKNEALIKVDSVGVCGTDIKIYDDHFPYNAPVIVGHEFAGIIEAVGKEVNGWRVGDRVVSEQHTLSCGQCRFCLTGKRHLCPSKKAPGYGVDGAFAEYITVPANLLHKIPDDMSLLEAALIEPMAVAAYGILGKTGISPEDYVVILGCGPIAILALQMVKSAGASTVVMTGIDADESMRFEFARECGADSVINVQKENPLTKVMADTENTGADVVIDLSGSPDAILQGLELIRKDGKFCALGIPNSSVPLPWQNLILKAANIIFSYSSDFTSWERCISMIRNKKLKLEKFTDTVFPLTRWEDAFKTARSGKVLKVIIRP